MNKINVLIVLMISLFSSVVCDAGEMHINIIERPSKNFENTAIHPEWIIIHCIGYNEKKALGLLLGDDPTVKGGAHYFIPQLDSSNTMPNPAIEYPVYHLVDDTLKAFHAGVSQWKQIEGFNDYSIGIEFNSPNYAYALDKPDQLNWYHFETFPSEQIEAGIILIKELIKKHHINPEHVLTHSDIAAWRFNNNQPSLGKTDPGSYFPMELLAKNGIGVWPAFKRTRNTKLDTSIENAQFLLKTFGYNLEVTGVLDVPTISSIKAFKTHFMPEEYHDDEVSDQINEKMIIGLENLIDGNYKYKITVG